MPSPVDALPSAIMIVSSPPPCLSSPPPPAGLVAVTPGGDDATPPPCLLLAAFLRLDVPREGPCSSTRDPPLTAATPYPSSLSLHKRPSIIMPPSPLPPALAALGVLVWQPPHPRLLDRGGTYSSSHAYWLLRVVAAGGGCSGALSRRTEPSPSSDRLITLLRLPPSPASFTWICA